MLNNTGWQAEIQNIFLSWNIPYDTLPNDYFKVCSVDIVDKK